jgi:hypothetical protein
MELASHVANASYSVGMRNAEGIVLALIWFVALYWVIRLAVRHAIADAKRVRDRRSTFAGVKLRPDGDSTDSE